MPPLRYRHPVISRNIYHSRVPVFKDFVACSLMSLSETGVFRIPSSPSWMSHRKYFTINFSWMEEFGGIPLHEAMISHGMFPLIVFMLFANMAIILAIKCAAITIIIDFGGNFRARRMLTTFDKTSRPTMTEPT